MDVAQGFNNRQQLLDASAPICETAIVETEPDINLFTMVNSTGTQELVRTPLGLQLNKGDTVLLLRGTSKRCWIVAKLAASRQLPNFGLVTIATGGSNTITVSYALGTSTVIVVLPFIASYVPSVGDTVRIIWEPTGGGYVIGKLGTVPLPPPIIDYNPLVLAPPPPSGTTGTDTFPAQDAISFRNGKWRSDSGDVVQSDWGGWGDNYGSWFYGNEPSNYLTGATITRLRIRVRRKSGGVYGAQTVHFIRHNSRTRPGGNVDYVSENVDAGVDIGQTVDVDLPISWGQDIVDNGGGISIANAPYVVLAGINEMSDSGLLMMDWSR